MRSHIAIWWLLTGFFLLCFGVYLGWSVAYLGHIEWTGTIALLFSAFMAALIAFYVQVVYRGQKGTELPEDRLDAEIDDGEAEQGEYSPWSWWPLVLGSAVAVAVVALATAHFLIPVAVGLLVVGLFGWVFEYYRGNFAR
ncbi:cytochrome c oxidase subunit 4 [Microbacterium betulae]|uniref:cytochrome-c oxidase n=1 Tax=Microbacterium betulae TaxID=2981139 RepID=A0AA97FF14_9MICO|nr:cytochrome c oxidase subunit 4 [Microbacterium sp. AB]WOF21820.1 cytochrome c oxidase subunit 4 [Microbacterium sp. AB]